MKPQRIFISAIDTNIGKTTVSAILCKSLQADYWKPVQSGELDNSDTIKVRRLLGKDYNGTIHPEAYAFKHPLSPHAAAELEGIQIDPNEIHIPPHQNNLIIEGAGGLMVPLNDHFTILDWIKMNELPVLLVTKNYLGSINHTLLSALALEKMGIKCLGLVINGSENLQSEKAIKSLSHLPIHFHVDWNNTVDASFIADQASRHKEIIQSLL